MATLATCTETQTKQPHPSGEGHIIEIVFTWLSTDLGVVGSDVSTTANKYTGTVLGVKTDPSGGGTAPSASYNLFVKDDTVATLVRNEASASATATEYTAAAEGVEVFDSALHITVDAAGDAKIGVAYVYLWVA